MGRTYAGILGPISFGVVIARSLIGSDGVEAALYTAPLALFVFAAIGYVIGHIAERTIVEGVEAQFHARLQADEKASSGTVTQTNLAGSAGPSA